MPIKITHLGAKKCVTGSCHLIETNPGAEGTISILVDCGTTYGADPQLPFADFPVPPAAIDYLFLTHAHIDHIGRIPDLIDAGFIGEIICTHGTSELLLPMLRDAMSFSARSKNEIHRLENRIEELTWGFELQETFSLPKNITFKLKNAGHILGSCFILFSFPTDTPQKPYRVLFSGDLGCKDTPILPDPDPPDPCDLLILESTYGDRLHPDRTARIATLKNLLDKALADKGIVYIPAFALGRTQELLYELDRIQPNVPVFVDSPLGLELTAIYSKLECCWDSEAQHLKAQGDHPFDFKGLYAVHNHRDHRQLLDISGPAVIIAGSGMCTGGRIVSHLEQGLSDARNDVIFVGYQAKGTPGRKMIDNQTPGKAAIHKLNSYSAHADQRMLLDWVASMAEPPQEIHLVHGEEAARRALAEALPQEIQCRY